MEQWALVYRLGKCRYCYKRSAAIPVRVATCQALYLIQSESCMDRSSPAGNHHLGSINEQTQIDSDETGSGHRTRVPDLFTLVTLNLETNMTRSWVNTLPKLCYCSISVTHVYYFIDSSSLCQPVMLNPTLFFVSISLQCWIDANTFSSTNIPCPLSM